MNQPSFRDVELLSAYLDGQLSQIDSSRLEARIKTDAELRSVYDDLRQTRTLLHKLPARRAPRNFMLTPKMAGIRPPLPRAFPLFRMASAIAAILLFFGFAANLFAPNLATQLAYDTSGAAGGGPGEQGPSIAAMAPLATEPPIPAGTQAPTVMMATITTDTPEATSQQDNTLAAPTVEAAVPAPQAKLNPNAENSAGSMLASEPQLPALPVPAFWLYGLLGLTVLSGGTALVVRARVEQAWRKANALAPARLSAREWLLLGLALLIVVLLAAGIYWISGAFIAPY